jgi:circadian clock protein KaiC
MPSGHTQDAGAMPARLSTGIAGLDTILCGGLIPRRAYLLRGGPGFGKTTLGMHFLTAGAHQGEQVVCITLAETEEQLRQNAAALGFDLAGITFLDLSPSADVFAAEETYDIFSPAEVEREPTTRKIIELVEGLKPSRVFMDSMTQFRYLSTDAFQFRKQVLSFLRFLIDHQATVLFTSETTSELPDDDLQYMSDGIIQLGFTPEGRSLTVSKFRGSDFSPGTHALTLSDRGITVFPKLPLTERRDSVGAPLSSGVPEIDELLHGGLERGTTTIITGPTGVGKTTLGLQFVKEAAGRGDESVAYIFEEGLQTLLNRCESINIPVHAMIERGTLHVVPIEPRRWTPDQFAYIVREEVEKHQRRIVMLDSVKGYGLMTGNREHVMALHALAAYLKRMGVSVLLTNEIENITGDFQATGAGLSYLADNIVFLRYLEIMGELRKAIGVLKKRVGSFERTLREIEITRYGIKVGGPLTNLRGLLRGTPEFLPPTAD